MQRNFKHIVKGIIEERYARQEEKFYEKKIRRSIAALPSVKLSKVQIDEIQDFWQTNFNRKVTTLWHEFYFARTGIFSPKFIPESVYRTSIVYTLNYHPFRNAYVDKGFYDTLFPQDCRPMTYVKNVNGHFYTDKSPITKEEAIRRCSNLESAIVKPTLEGTWGEGVNLIKTKDGKVLNKEEFSTVESLFEHYGNGFIIQERINQHQDIAALNPDSVNTLRVLTYRSGNEVVVLYAVIRIGRKGKSVDNETAGGIKADVDLRTGRIRGCATGTPKEGLIYHTDVGTPIENYQLPSFDLVLEKAKELHLSLPYFNLVGWDFSVNAQGVPIMVEFNRAPDLSQVAHGPAFGDYTEEILQRALNNPNTRQYFL